MEFELCLNPPQAWWFTKFVTSFKDAIEPGCRQGAIYKINCIECDQCYSGETKRWFEMRQKERMSDAKNDDNFYEAYFLVL